MVLESSLNGCPLQEISNALYHPKGTLLTFNPSASKASSASFNTWTATFGELKEEDKWAYGYKTIFSALTWSLVLITSLTKFLTIPCGLFSSSFSTAVNTTTDSSNAPCFLAS